MCPSVGDLWQDGHWTPTRATVSDGCGPKIRVFRVFRGPEIRVLRVFRGLDPRLA